MYRLIFILTSIFLSSNSVIGQIGINTSNPLGTTLHIDPKGNTSGTVQNAVNDADDVFISADGRLGIGTVNPKAKLSVVAEDNTTGLQLPNGAEENFILISDIDGNASWGSSSIQYLTFVANTQNIDQQVSGSGSTGMQIKTFGSALVDTTKEYYGDAYGWNDVSQQYKAPKSGLYRITSQVYCLPNTKNTNYRTYWYQNNTMSPALGFYSYIDTGSPVSAYTSNVVRLNKDDVLDLRLYCTNTSNTSIKYKQGLGYTFIIIEMLQ